MGVTLLFDSRHRVLLARFDGTVTAETIREMSAAAHRFADKNGACSAIADFTDCQRFEVESEFIRDFARAKPVMSGHKRVLVAPPDVIFGTLRMFELHQPPGGDEPVAVVRALERAYQLLGVGVPDFRPITAA